MASKYKVKNLKLTPLEADPNTLVATWDKVSDTKIDGKGTQKGSKIDPVKDLEYTWTYTVRKADGKTVTLNGMSSDGSTSTTHIGRGQTRVTFTPDKPEATKITFKIRSNPKTYKNKGSNKEHPYFTKKWVTRDKTLGAPDFDIAPTISIKGFTLTATLTGLTDTVYDGKTYGIGLVEFQLLDEEANQVGNIVSTESPKSTVKVTFDIEAGHSYSVRARVTYVPDGKKSDWGPESEESDPIPSAPTNLEARGLSGTSVELSWDPVPGAESYEIEYVNQISEFGKGVAKTATFEEEQGIIESMETGQIYYFRVRAVQGSYKSSWFPDYSYYNSDYYAEAGEVLDQEDLNNLFRVVQVILGRPPAAPSTYSLASTVKAGDIATLYWIHNAQDNSTQVGAMIEFTFSNMMSGETVTGYRYVANRNYNNEYTKDENLFYELDTSVDFTMASTEERASSGGASYDILLDLSYGCTIEWRVKTKGVDPNFGAYSVIRRIDVVAPPTLSIRVSSVSAGWVWDQLSFPDGAIDATTILPQGDSATITALPLAINMEAGPANQTPLSYVVEVISVESYSYENEFGEIKMVRENELMYSTYINSDSHSQVVNINAFDMRFEDSKQYYIVCTVVMNTGLTASAGATCSIDFDEPDVDVDATFTPDEYSYSLSITPIVSYTNDWDGEGEDPEPVLVNNVSISIYREDAGGQYTLIADNVENGSPKVDPHPTLGSVQYIIAATFLSTGYVAWDKVYYDFIDQPGLIIEWDERWSDAPEDNDIDTIDPDYAQQFKSGARLFLPYNVDISEQHQPDAQLVSYIGRSRPVGYYGTQLGESYTFKTDIVKSEVELGEAINGATDYTVELLRRLSNYMGDVYIRESMSRLGFWANVKVSFDFTHTNKLIPVTLTVTRVEGGA